VAQDICRVEEPPLEPKGSTNHLAACHFSETSAVEELAAMTAIETPVDGDG
jgi:hypothetical protein